MSLGAAGVQVSGVQGPPADAAHSCLLPPEKTSWYCWSKPSRRLVQASAGLSWSIHCSTPLTEGAAASSWSRHTRAEARRSSSRPAGRRRRRRWVGRRGGGMGGQSRLVAALLQATMGSPDAWLVRCRRAGRCTRQEAARLSEAVALGAGPGSLRKRYHRTLHCQQQWPRHAVGLAVACHVMCCSACCSVGCCKVREEAEEEDELV